MLRVRFEIDALVAALHETSRTREIAATALAHRLGVSDGRRARGFAITAALRIRLRIDACIPAARGGVRRAA